MFDFCKKQITQKHSELDSKYVLFLFARYVIVIYYLRISDLKKGKQDTLLSNWKEVYLNEYSMECLWYLEININEHHENVVYMIIHSVKKYLSKKEILGILLTCIETNGTGLNFNKRQENLICECIEEYLLSIDDLKEQLNLII